MNAWWLSHCVLLKFHLVLSFVALTIFKVCQYLFAHSNLVIFWNLYLLMTWIVNLFNLLFEIEIVFIDLFLFDLWWYLIRIFNKNCLRTRYIWNVSLHFLGVNIIFILHRIPWFLSLCKRIESHYIWIWFLNLLRWLTKWHQCFVVFRVISYYSGLLWVLLFNWLSWW
mgnify:CR=1 FL=1